MPDFSTDLTTKKISISLDTQNFEVKLARTGGQGSKGDSVTAARIENGEFIFTVTRADSTTYDINAGSASGSYSLAEMGDVTLTTRADNDVIIYNEETSQFENHQLTTARISNIDETNKEDGAVLVYDNSSGKYQATNRIEKNTTNIIGGSY